MSGRNFFDDLKKFFEIDTSDPTKGIRISLRPQVLGQGQGRGRGQGQGQGQGRGRGRGRGQGLGRALSASSLALAEQDHFGD